MPTARDDLLAVGESALAVGAWSDARKAFHGAVEAGDSESGEALLGLATALWWLGEMHDAVEYKERAYAAFRCHDDQTASALVAWQLSIDYGDCLHNAAAARGWLARTRRLIAEHDLSALTGWVLLLEAHYTIDPRECERLSREVLELARTNMDTDLQLCALSQLGTALVDLGRVTEGVGMLDEAMAGSLGGDCSRPDSVVFTSCNTLQACTSCADFERAAQWLRATDRFAQRFGSPYLRADCRIHYATMLMAIGDWVQADEELMTAITVSTGRLPVLHGDALAALASLRLAQGLLDEAARLVDGLLERPGAAAVIGEVHLWRRRPESARSVLQRALATLGPDRLQAVVLRELLGQALIGCGEVGAAAEDGAAITELGATHDCTIGTAYGARLSGRAAAAGGDSPAARAHLDIALTAFAEMGMPYEAARTRLLLARSLRAESTQSAVDEARGAFADLDGLGARAHADEAAALLRELGATPVRSRARAAGSLTPREAEVLALLGEGLSNPEIAERLYLSRKTVEHHVARILAKLNLRNRAEAAATAVRGAPSP